MRDPVSAHRALLQDIRRLVDAITPGQVADAFVASLTFRRLAERSALGSYAVARVLPDHEFSPRSGTYAAICNVCRWSQMPKKEEEEPIEILVKERERFGGVRHDYPLYIHTDLTLFQQLPTRHPTEADWSLLRQILETPARLEPNCKAEDLQRALIGVIRSNRNERFAMLIILAIAGILKPRDYPTYFEEFVRQRPLPPQRFADWGYPTIWWRAADGYSTPALRFWFPRLLERLSANGLS